MFRKVMLLGLGKHISWSKEVVGYEENDDAVGVHFSDGSSDDDALLIGDDGAHSKVRQQYIPDHEIVPTSMICVYGK